MKNNRRTPKTQPRTTAAQQYRTDREAFRSAENEAFRAAQNQLYLSRHFLLAPGGPGNMHDSLTSQFQHIAIARGIRISEETAGLHAAYWVQWWVAKMTGPQIPLGLRFTNSEKKLGNENSAISRGKTKTTLAYRAHRLRRAGLSNKRIAAMLDRSERTIRSYIATPFSTVQPIRQRITQPTAKERAEAALQANHNRLVHTALQAEAAPITAEIYCLLIGLPSKEVPEIEEPTDSKLPDHTEIDPIQELKAHWSRTDSHKKHNPTELKPPQRAKSLMRQAP